MPDPTFLQTPYLWDQRQIVKFGGLPIPVWGTVMPYQDLNDCISWICVSGPKIDNSHISNAASQLAWRGKGVWTVQDFYGRKLRLPVYYSEAGAGIPFSRAKANLTQSGEQYLTFDNVTGLLVRVNSFGESDFVTDAPEAPGQYLMKTTLEFLSRNPFPQDIAATTAGPFTLNLNSAAPFTAACGGHVYAEPVYTFTIPSGNTSNITKFTLTNTDSGDSVFFINTIRSGVGHTVVIDSSALTIAIDGKGIAPNGAGFPMMYPNIATGGSPTNHFTLTTVGGTGTCTLNMSWHHKWEL